MGGKRGDFMKCDRCGADTSTEQYDVDEFTGRLCDECVEQWEQITSDQGT
jgi:hypothetical protein